MTERPHTGTTEPAARPPLPLKAYALTGVICALVGFGAVYATLGGRDNGAKAPAASPTPTVPPAGAPLPSGPGRNPLSVGHMSAFVFKSTPAALPDVSFVDATGTKRTLADWKGKIVLLNLWATWCVPCRKEMPALDRLQQELGSDRFEVVAVSVDRAGTAGARKFLDQIKVKNLKVLADPDARMAATLKAVGLPTTLLLDTQGREIGRLVGPAEWDSAEAKSLIKASMR